MAKELESEILSRLILRYTCRYTRIHTAYKLNLSLSSFHEEFMPCLIKFGDMPMWLCSGFHAIDVLHYPVDDRPPQILHPPLRSHLVLLEDPLPNPPSRRTPALSCTSHRHIRNLRDTTRGF